MKKYVVILMAAVMAVCAAACSADALPAAADAASRANSSLQTRPGESSSESVRESPDGKDQTDESSDKYSKKDEKDQSSSSKESSQGSVHSSAESSEPPESSKTESAAQSSAASETESSLQSSAAEQSSQNTPVQKTAETEGISLSASEITITLGDTYRLYVSIHPDNAARTDFTWYWSDDSIITMNSDGVITAKAIGKATITAETHNRKTAVCEVTVVEKLPEPSTIPEDQPIEYKAAPELTGTRVGSDWFDDAVFVGDSVTNGLSFYADNGSLGNADFLCAVSLGYNNAMWGIDYQYNVHPKYNGKKVLVEDGVRMSGKKKVFIMLGMNDIGGYGVDGTINAMKKLTDRILRKSPDVQIYIQSVTPLLKNIRRDDMLNNANVAKFNEKAKQVCAERGFIFVDVASAVSDGQGNLVYENCGDPDYMGLHFSNTGCKNWVAYLYDHVA